MKQYDLGPELKAMVFAMELDRHKKFQVSNVNLPSSYTFISFYCYVSPSARLEGVAMPPQICLFREEQQSTGDHFHQDVNRGRTKVGVCA